MSDIRFLADDEKNEVIHKIIEENVNKAKHTEIFARTLYERITKNDKLKITTSEISSEIFPHSSVFLYDVKVDGRFENMIYKKDKWVRENIPRGMTFIEIKGEIQYFDIAIFANKKFCGSEIDDDSFVVSSEKLNLSWETFFIQPPEMASEIVCMDKLDGEAGHFTVRKIKGEFYIIAGSKNVHILFQTYEDIEKYTNSRFLVAKSVAKTVLNTFAKLDEGKLSILKDLLDKTKMTVVCELMQPVHQHITNLSSYNESTINVLLFSSTASETTEDSLTALPPHLALQFANFFGFTTPKYEILPASEIRDFKRVKSLHKTEGNVLYYLLNNNTIGMVKVKTVWYVMLLTLREKGVRVFNSKKKVDNAAILERIDITKKQFTDLQVKIGFTDEYRIKWEQILEQFLYWLSDEINEKRIKVKDINFTFPMLWDNFLTSKNVTDKFDLTFA